MTVGDLGVLCVFLGITLPLAWEYGKLVPSRLLFPLFFSVGVTLINHAAGLL